MNKDDKNTAMVEEPKICPPLYMKLTVIAVMSVMLFLSGRTLLLDDAQYGWGMFSKQINYTLRYEWVMANGKTIRYKPGKEVRKKNRYIAERMKTKRTRYGTGAVARWVNRYLEFVYENKKQSGAIAIRAILKYQINLDNSTWTTKTYTYPKSQRVTND